MAFRGVALRQKILRIDHHHPDDHEHERQTQTECDQKHQAQAHPPQRDRTQQQDQCGFARHQSAADCQSRQTAPANLVRHVMTVNMAARAVRVDQLAVGMRVIVSVCLRHRNGGFMVMQVRVRMIVMMFAVRMCVRQCNGGFMIMHVRMRMSVRMVSVGMRLRHRNGGFVSVRVGMIMMFVRVSVIMMGVALLNGAQTLIEHPPAYSHNRKS